jgi:hypothetical protein
MACKALFRLAMIVILYPIWVHAQAGSELDADQLKTLVTGRTSAMSFQGNLSNPATVSYWDFKADGSICARFVGSKPKDKCADDGTWQVKGNVLCWELQRIGETHAFKSTCVRVRKVDNKRYEANAVEGFKMAPLAFYPIK